MKKLITGLIFFIFLLSSYGQYQGPVPPIESGFGADGSHKIQTTNIQNDHFPQKDISVFSPDDISQPVPTIFFSHGFGGNDTSFYIQTLRHIASKGYAVVFVPYKTLKATIPERYATLFDGFTKAARTLTTIIDTTRVGFYGHSFGGGATPGLALKAFRQFNWGAKGKFIYCAAPWYSYEISKQDLNTYPEDCNMLTVLYDEDKVNDHRMGIFIFNTISINKESKDCLTVLSKTLPGYTYVSDHYLPTQYSPNGKGKFDALDYYVTFRLLDAMADFTFTGNPLAKKVALGNGAHEQIYMGKQLPSLIATDNPSPAHSQSQYRYRCNSRRNPFRSSCRFPSGR